MGALIRKHVCVCVCVMWVHIVEHSPHKRDTIPKKKKREWLFFEAGLRREGEKLHFLSYFLSPRERNL